MSDMAYPLVYDTLCAIRDIYPNVPREQMRLRYAYEDGLITPQEADELADWVMA